MKKKGWFKLEFFLYLGCLHSVRRRKKKLRKNPLHENKISVGKKTFQGKQDESTSFFVLFCFVVCMIQNVQLECYRDECIYVYYTFRCIEWNLIFMWPQNKHIIKCRETVINFTIQMQNFLCLIKLLW